MQRVAAVAIFAAAIALCGSAYAQEPASTDGKSVPMEQAPAKIKKGKAATKHQKASRHSKQM